MQVFNVSDAGNITRISVGEAGEPFKEQVRIHIFCYDGSTTLYLTLAEAESLAFQINAFVQEHLTGAGREQG